MLLQKLILYISSILILNWFLTFYTISAIEMKQQKTGRIFDFDLIAQLFDYSDDEDSWENEKPVVVCKYPNCTVIVQETNNTSATPEIKCNLKDVQTQWSNINNLKYRIKSDWNDLLRNIDEITSNNIKLKALKTRLKKWNKKIKDIDVKIKETMNKIKSDNEEIERLKAELKEDGGNSSSGAARSHSESRTDGETDGDDDHPMEIGDGEDRLGRQATNENDKKDENTKKKKRKINNLYLEVQKNKAFLMESINYLEQLRSTKQRATQVKKTATDRNTALNNQNLGIIDDIISHWKDIESNWAKIKEICKSMEDKWTTITTNWSKFERLLQSLKTIKDDQPNRINSDIWRDFDSALDILIWTLAN